MTPSRGCLSPHVPAAQRDHDRLTWLAPCPAPDRVRVVAWTCVCRAVYYELCEAGGQALIRRTVQGDAGNVVRETHRYSIAEARTVWTALLSGQAR